MDLPLQIAAGILAIAGFAVLFHFLYTASSAPEKINLGLVYDRKHTTGSRIYLVSVVASWAAFAFSGAYGFLSWSLEEHAIGASTLVALWSLPLLIHIERSAYAQHALRRSALIRRELEQLIRHATIPSRGIIEKYSDKAKSAESLAEREAHAELSHLAAMLADRDNKLCEYAVSQAQREAEESVQQRETTARHSQAIEEKQARLAQLKHALEKSMASLPTIKTLDAAEKEMSLLDTNVAKQKWQPLSDFANRLQRGGATAPVASLLEPIAGLRIRNGATFEVRLSGNERDGHYEVRSLIGGSLGELADALIFESSLDGAIAAFFLRAALPGRLAWGHGLYDRDQKFVTSLEQAIDILNSDDIAPDTLELLKVTVQPGLRIKLTDGAISLSCLTYRPGKGFYDSLVKVTEGVASPDQETKLFKWGRGIFY